MEERQSWGKTGKVRCHMEVGRGPLKKEGGWGRVRISVSLRIVFLMLRKYETGWLSFHVELEL